MPLILKNLEILAQAADFVEAQDKAQDTEVLVQDVDLREEQDVNLPDITKETSSLDQNFHEQEKDEIIEIEMDEPTVCNFQTSNNPFEATNFQNTSKGKMRDSLKTLSIVPIVLPRILMNKAMNSSSDVQILITPNREEAIVKTGKAKHSIKQKHSKSQKTYIQTNFIRFSDDEIREIKEKFITSLSEIYNPLIHHTGCGNEILDCAVDSIAILLDNCKYSKEICQDKDSVHSDIEKGTLCFSQEQKELGIAYFPSLINYQLQNCIMTTVSRSIPVYRNELKYTPYNQGGVLILPKFIELHKNERKMTQYYDPNEIDIKIIISSSCDKSYKYFRDGVGYNHLVFISMDKIDLKKSPNCMFLFISEFFNPDLTVNPDVAKNIHLAIIHPDEINNIREYGVNVFEFEIASDDLIIRQRYKTKDITAFRSKKEDESSLEYAQNMIKKLKDFAYHKINQEWKSIYDKYCKGSYLHSCNNR